MCLCGFPASMNSLSKQMFFTFLGADSQIHNPVILNLLRENNYFWVRSQTQTRANAENVVYFPGRQIFVMSKTECKGNRAEVQNQRQMSKNTKGQAGVLIRNKSKSKTINQICRKPKGLGKLVNQNKWFRKESQINWLNQYRHRGKDQLFDGERVSRLRYKYTGETNKLCVWVTGCEEGLNNLPEREHMGNN